MAKKSWSTRIDTDVLALAQRIGEAERRSVTAVFEVAVIEYAEKRGFKVGEKPEGEDDPAGGPRVRRL